MNTSLFKTALLSVLVLALLAGLWGCGGPRELSSLPARDLFDMGMEKYEKGKYLRATELFQVIVFNYPGEALVDTAQYYLALSYFGDEDYTLAGVEFNRLLLNYPSSVYASQAQLMKAVCFFEGTPRHYGLDQSDLEIAVRQFEDFIIDYPEASAMDDAKSYLNRARARLARKLYMSAIVYTRVSDYRAARVYFQKVIDEYTDSEFAPKATYSIAESYLRAREWDEAHERFTSFRIVFPDHEWAGKAAEQACEAAFGGGVEAFKKGDYPLARKRFDRFVTVCGHDEGKAKKANRYLREIGEAHAEEAQGENAGS